MTIEKVLLRRKELEKNRKGKANMDKQKEVKLRSVLDYSDDVHKQINLLKTADVFLERLYEDLCASGTKSVGEYPLETFCAVLETISMATENLENIPCRV